MNELIEEHLMTDKISAVIPTFNSAKTLGECLSALHKLSSENSIEVEAIIVDAGSTDETLAISKKYSATILVSPGVTRGEARNLGAKKAANNTIAFLDSDCVITAKWIEHLLKTPKDLGSTVVSGPAALVEAHTSVGSAVRDLLSNQFFTLASYTFSLDTDQKEVEDVPSSNLLVSKTFFNQIGGFPDLNFNEDGVFCKRVLDNNGKIVYYPSFKVIHKKTFNSVYRFASYFFQYGKSYGKNLKQYPGLINRYGLFALFFAFILVLGLFTFLFLADFALVPYLAIPVLVYMSLMLSYSLLKFRKIHAGIIPLLFVTLVISYLGGFYYGFIKSLRNHKIRQSEQ